MSASRSKTALILTGGGARAAYQVGVLAAIRDLLPDTRQNPFPILCGTSAGAINAASLATQADDFGFAVSRLEAIWGNFHVRQVYRADTLGISLTGMRWLASLLGGWLVKQVPRSLLDNAPLRELLLRHLNFDRIESAIASGALHSVSITCSGYGSGQSVSFFQGGYALESWQRSQRFGVHTRLNVDHLMASSAIPFVFPAVRINREYFGDGSMRQVAPISPAIHLGADKILVVGAGQRNAGESYREYGSRYPSLAQIAGHALSSIFLDSLSVDLERLMRINRTLNLIPEDVRLAQGLPLRPIEALEISPSKRLDHIAARHVRSLPWALRALLGNIGALNKRGGALASYLLFEASYTRALIELGYHDAQERRDEILAFLDISPSTG
ncbi:putative esterase of the alpha-beta hydrolase superfamily [Sterolibacterium denitrificans]|uniref:Esterase of the alpha-beta hydrolase superfamily n=1 Tax=Sterolibacterium denitrificans TaxID=157592 RepID=A0A7Z7MV56_9PROT|nr:patatin-like phospholipase family protein [Sterolibacterium denitrificans]SMB24162.1 putative esterase of the alpha-beta hydrolase superfamily [Sterolibacterium denitrificans]